MKRIVLVTFAVAAYIWFLIDIGWAILFLADIGVGTGVDRGRIGPLLPAVVINLVLLLAFAVHHSVTARDSVKRHITKVIPASAERSTYVFAADVLVALVLWQWQPIGGTVWNVTRQPWSLILWFGYGLGWAST